MIKPIDLSTREKQVYGALCLRRFCLAKGVKHPYIDELIEHLLSILITRELDMWESHGSVLELSGRGDPIPKAIETLLVDDVREDFTRMVDYVVEIAMSDMYSESSMEPLNYLLRCQAILDANGIGRPEVGELFDDRVTREDDTPIWGELYTQEEYERVRSLFY